MAAGGGNPCGPFTVEHHGDRTLVVCHGCGDLKPGGTRGTWIDAERIPGFVHALRGPLSRFVVPASRAHRAALADALEAVA